MATQPVPFADQDCKKRLEAQKKNSKKTLSEDYFATRTDAMVKNKL